MIFAQVVKKDVGTLVESVGNSIHKLLNVSEALCWKNFFSDFLDFEEKNVVLSLSLVVFCLRKMVLAKAPPK